MTSSPILTFKAGQCNRNGRKVVPNSTSGYIYLYNDEDLLHFCWRSRSKPSTDPDLDLLMLPGDGSFTPLLKEQGAEDLHSPTTGRIYVLKFSSSNQKHYFWMQSKTQHKEGSLSWFSQRDQRLGQIVDLLLQGDDVDVEQELEEVRRNGGGDDENGSNDDTDAMEVDDQPRNRQNRSGGTGQGDTRDGGAGRDGGRAEQSQDTDALVQNFLASLQGAGSNNNNAAASVDTPFTTLPDLLTPSTTLSFLGSAIDSQVDHLCSYLPADLFLLAQQTDSSSSASDPEPSTAAAKAAIEALTSAQKKDIIARVLRSPQLQQSLGSLTVALRDGGLPMIGEALRLKVANGGLMRGGSMPLGGGQAVQGFVEGVKKTVEDEDESKTS
nr:proteasomal ubiquitin receptor adrm1-b [Quercus suber]